jgi:hypothetical protein
VTATFRIEEARRKTTRMMLFIDRTWVISCRN